MKVHLKKLKESNKSTKLNEFRDFDWTEARYGVVKDDGDYAGVPCLTSDEARELALQHPGSKIYQLSLDSIANGNLEAARSNQEY